MHMQSVLSAVRIQLQIVNLNAQLEMHIGVNTYSVPAKLKYVHIVINVFRMVIQILMTL